MKRWLPLLLFLAAPVRAASDLPAARWANEQLPDPRQEAQAKALMEELRCLVCQGQSITDSNAEMARDMRAMVRQRIAARKAGGGPHLVDRALWQLGQLPSAGGAGDLALVGGAVAVPGGRRLAAA